MYARTEEGHTDTADNTTQKRKKGETHFACEDACFVEFSCVYVGMCLVREDGQASAPGSCILATTTSAAFKAAP